MNGLTRRLSLGLILAFALLALPSIPQAAPLWTEEPATTCADSFTVTLTTFSYTQVPSSPCSSRFGIVLRNPGSNSGNIVCKGGEQDENTTPTWTTGDGAFEISAGGYDFLRFDNRTRVYCYSRHTSAEAVKGQELKPSSRTGGW